MIYITSQSSSGSRSPTYRSVAHLKAGDTVVTANGAKLTVTDESVDMAWVEACGSDKVAAVRKYEEYRIVDIRDRITQQTRSDGRYPVRIGRIIKKPNPHTLMPMFFEYFRIADGSDYSGMVLRTSRVIYHSADENG